MTVLKSSYAFVHVPKAAGRSINKALGGETPGVPTHVPHFALGQYGFTSGFTFGFVRNPWDRTVSVYNFLCQKKLRPYEPLEYQQAIKQMGFRRWLLEDGFYMDQDKHWRTEHLAPIQSRSQMFWLEGCDFIGKVETIDADFDEIKRRIGLNNWLDRLLGPFRRVPHKNKSSHAAYQTYYDDVTKQFVADHFEPEITRFGYQF